MNANPTLQGTLPRLYNKDNIDQRRLGELIDLFNSARFSRQGEHRARDLMGEVYEYFLGNFARAEGKRGGEFFTPPSVVRGDRRGARADAGPGVRPVLRLGRHVRPDREVHLRARRRPQGHRHLRPGVHRGDLADGEDEPRHPRHRQQGPRRPVGRHVRPRPARRRPDGLRPGEPAVQHQGLGPQRSKTHAGSSASHPPTTPTTPGSSTSCPSSLRAAELAW